MKTPFILNVLMAVAICISQPACIVPVNTTYETARSLGRLIKGAAHEMADGVVHFYPCWMQADGHFQ